MLRSERCLRTIVASVAIAATVGLAGKTRAEGAQPERPQMDDTVAGEQAVHDALAWLDLVDRGSYGESWDAAAPLFRRALPREQWVQKIAGLRPALGAIVSRRVKSIKRASSLAGAPDGDYVIIQFSTTFEKKKSAIETATPMRQPDGAWKIAGYFIK